MPLQYDKRQTIHVIGQVISVDVVMCAMTMTTITIGDDYFLPAFNRFSFLTIYLRHTYRIQTNIFTFSPFIHLIGFDMSRAFIYAKSWILFIVVVTKIMHAILSLSHCLIEKLYSGTGQSVFIIRFTIRFLSTSNIVNAFPTMSSTSI